MDGFIMYLLRDDNDGGCGDAHSINEFLEAAVWMIMALMDFGFWKSPDGDNDNGVEYTL